MPQWIFISLISAYIFACRLVMRRLAGDWRESLFALLNVAGLYGFLFYGHKQAIFRFAVYLLLILFQFFMLRLFSQQQGWKPWLAFFTPLLALVVFRYVPASFYARLPSVAGMHFRGNPNMVGISYLAFRCSHLILEIRTGAVRPPGFWRYVSFCFFVPTMPVGPINTYHNFSRAYEDSRPVLPASRSALRILVGLVKFQFLGGICNRLTYAGLLFNDHLHPWMDLPVAMLFYYLYLYCNFSGFCDMAIGAAGLIGVPVPENFDNPFAARNVKDFWNRWHITLSTYMRDVVFFPLSKFLVHALGTARVNHAIALTITVVFLLVGVWHGVGWNYAAFGAVHALGVVVNHYYTIFLKKRLGRDGFKAYNENRWIHGAAVMLTFCYIAMSLFLFANTFPEMKLIFQSLR